MDFVTIKPKASKQVKYLMTDFPSDIGLRLAVKGGGCSGLSYDLQFTAQEEDDTIFENDGYKIFMDSKSMIYLKGMALDYDDGLNGKGFQFINPNATQTCGCGESFSMN